MSYTYLFYQHIMFRKSCGNCHYTNLKRPSDITIADFWGWEKTDPSFNADDMGASLVFVNTEKGKDIFEAAKERMNTIPVKIEDCLQPNLCGPSEIDCRRDEFEKDFERRGFKYVYYKYSEEGWRYKTREKYRTLRGHIGRILRKIGLR